MDNGVRLEALLNSHKECRELMKKLRTYSAANTQPKKDLCDRFDAVMLICRAANTDFSFGVDESQYDEFSRILTKALKKPSKDKNSSLNMLSEFTKVVNQYEKCYKDTRRTLGAPAGVAGIDGDGNQNQ